MTYRDRPPHGTGFLFMAVLLLGMVFGALIIYFSRPAHSAEAEYCRPYAAQISQRLIVYVWNRLYTTCLNSDEPPPMTLGDMGAWSLVFEKNMTYPGMDTTGMADKPASGAGSKPAISHQADLTDQTWMQSCKRNFRSWRASDQTVITYYSGHQRVRCPCPDHCDKP